jgi:hypothetical protein
VIKFPQISLLLGALLLAGPALGACADSPAPGVVWRRCLLDNVDLSGRDLTGATLRDSSFATDFPEVDRALLEPDQRWVTAFDLVAAQAVAGSALVQVSAGLR